MLIRDRAVVAAGVSKEDLAQLLTMGFHEQQARAALEARLVIHALFHHACPINHHACSSSPIKHSQHWRFLYNSATRAPAIGYTCCMTISGNRTLSISCDGWLHYAVEWLTQQACVRRPRVVTYARR